MTPLTEMLTPREKAQQTSDLLRPRIPPRKKIVLFEGAGFFNDLTEVALKAGSGVSGLSLRREGIGKCRGGDLNPYALRRQILSLVRLPISPPRPFKATRVALIRYGAFGPATQPESVLETTGPHRPGPALDGCLWVGKQ